MTKIRTSELKISRYAPVALFIYNRAEHLQQTLASLMSCDGFAESPIYVFGDGPRSPEQQSAVDAARAIVLDTLGDRAEYCFQSTNKGLARSIVDGVRDVTREYGRVIVVEDDLELAPNFLTYMNDALDRYARDENVFQVSGHAFESPEFANSRRAVMLPITTTWGWGTWHRAWDRFDEKACGWEVLKKDRVIRCEFNLGGAYDYASMLENQMRGKRDSWGIRWYWTVFRNGGLTVFPPATLVRNAGMDGSGTHGRGWFRKSHSTSTGFTVSPISLPPAELIPANFETTCRALRRQNGGTVGFIVDLIKNLRIWVLQ